MTHFRVPKATTTKSPYLTLNSPVFIKISSNRIGETDEHLHNSTNSALNSGKYQFLSLYLPH